MRPIYGHEALLHRLAGAIASSRFPQAVLFTGMAGVGKQRIALWAAQALLCDSGTGTPCGACPACHQVLGLRHPDLHWFVPIPRPKAGAVDKQVEQAAEQLGAVMAERRDQPLYDRPDGMASHSLASIRLLQRVVVVTPFQGDRKVIVLGDAERLVVQEASQEAANALLKVLEEPPADAVLILTSSEPQALLPTIRSRMVPIRVGRVTDETVRAFLEEQLDPPLEGQALRQRTLLAEGSIGRAIWADAAAGRDADRAAAALLEAVNQGSRSWARQALRQSQWGARGDFSSMLDALALRIRDRLAELTSADAATPDLDSCLEALGRVEQARAEARGNVNPQLSLAVLAGDLERLL